MIRIILPFHTVGQFAEKSEGSSQQTLISLDVHYETFPPGNDLRDPRRIACAGPLLGDLVTTLSRGPCYTSRAQT